MTQVQSSPIPFGRLLAVTSRPQNVVFSGLLTLVATTIQDEFWRGVWCYLLLWTLYAIAATYNNLHDIKTDQLNTHTNNPFADGRLGKRSGYVWLSINIVVLAGLQFFLAQPVSILVTLAYLVLLGAYSHGKLRLQSRGFVAPFVLAICYAGLPIILGSGQSQPIYWGLAGILTFLCVPLLLAKDYKDLTGDKATGKQTPLVRYGAQTVKNVSLYIALCGCLMVIGYLIGTRPQEHSLQVVLSGICLAAYYFSVWYLHDRQSRRHRYFLRLPQLALLVLVGCLLTL